MFRPLRLVFRIAGLVIAAIVIYLAVTAVQVVLASRKNQTGPAQAIVVLGAAQYDGAPSPDLAARLGHALGLWQSRDAPVIVVTGGSQPGDLYSEAGVGASYLRRRGVPASDILEQQDGNDSWQSLAAAATTLKAQGRTAVILVSDPFHNARIADMASELGLQPMVSPTRTSPIQGKATYPYFAKETVAVAVGRVIGFSRLSGASATVDRVHARLGGG